MPNEIKIKLVTKVIPKFKGNLFLIVVIICTCNITNGGNKSNQSNRASNFEALFSIHNGESNCIKKLVDEDWFSPNSLSNLAWLVLSLIYFTFFSFTLYPANICTIFYIFFLYLGTNLYGTAFFFNHDNCEFHTGSGMIIFE